MTIQNRIINYEDRKARLISFRKVAVNVFVLKAQLCLYISKLGDKKKQGIFLVLT
jgi:hypothetical protein